MAGENAHVDPADGVVMPTATLRFDLNDPEDERSHRYSLAGRDALLALDELDNAMRAKLKYCDLTHETRVILEEIRSLIPHQLTSILE